MNLTKRNRYLLSLLSGVLMAISFPFTGSLTPLVFVAWIPLLLVEDSISENRYRSRKVFLHAYISFFIYNIITTWWIWNADQSGAIMAFVFNSFLMAGAFQLYHFCKKHIGKKEGYIGLLLIWIAFEYAHFHWELSWPWLTIGNVFSIRVTWIQWYEYTGVLGGSLWVLLVNLFGYKILKNVFGKKETWNIQTPLIGLWVVFLITPIIISVIQYARYSEKGKKEEIVLAQPNIDPYNEKFGGMGPGQQLQRIADIVEKKITKNTAMVLAPETAIPIPFDEAIVQYDPGYEILSKRRDNWNETELLIGASTYRYFDHKQSRASHKDRNSGNSYIENYNSSVFLDTANRPFIIHKSKLVLGAEKVPFSDWLPFLENLSMDLGGTTGTLGIEKGPKIFKSHKFAFAPVVCYESIYGEFIAEQCRLGAETIFIITNDGWWDDTPGYKQHFSFARLRAIETRRSVARSANTGTSGFINQRGDVVQKSDWWKIQALKGTVTLNKEMTIYIQLGDAIGRTFSFVAILLILLGFVRKIKPKSQKSV